MGLKGGRARLESSPCSLWQSEQEALSIVCLFPEGWLLSSRLQQHGSTGGVKKKETEAKETGSSSGVWTLWGQPGFFFLAPTLLPPGGEV